MLKWRKSIKNTFDNFYDPLQTSRNPKVNYFIQLIAKHDKIKQNKKKEGKLQALNNIIIVRTS